MSKFTDLITRLESGSGEDRVLDGEIWKVVEEKPGDVWSNEISADGVWFRQWPDDTIAWDSPPPFSRSLDAVIALVERTIPGCRGHVGWGVEGSSAVIGPPTSVGSASNPARATCAALLRALEAREGRTP